MGKKIPEYVLIGINTVLIVLLSVVVVASVFFFLIFSNCCHCEDLDK